MAKKKLDQIVYELIIKKIENGQLHEKEHITEQGIADELQISRTPVRKAFEQLVEDNYLENIENIGVRVKRQTLDVKAFQERIDFVEHLVNYYLFYLEKQEMQFNTDDLEKEIELMKDSINIDDYSFEKYNFAYWKQLLTYHKNNYAKKNILITFQDLLFDSGEIREILKDGRNLIVEHALAIASYLAKGNYAATRREIRILFNRLKLNVIEKNQNYW